MIAALISAIALIVASAATIFLTKKKERDAEWCSKKLAYYEEFIAAGSGIVGKVAPPEAKIRFANAVNKLHLIGSQGVLTALHQFCDEIAESNQNRSDELHDKLWSRLVWEIRSDLNDPPTRTPQGFRARLWASGVQDGPPTRQRGAFAP